MRILSFILLIVTLALTLAQDPPECLKPCTQEYSPICGNNGEDEKQFPNSCTMEYANCVNRHSNVPEYQRTGKPFCNEADKPSWWPAEQ